MTSADKTQALIEEARQWFEREINYTSSKLGLRLVSALEAEKARADALHQRAQEAVRIARAAVDEDSDAYGHMQRVKALLKIDRLLADSQDNQEATK